MISISPNVSSSGWSGLRGRKCPCPACARLPTDGDESLAGQGHQRNNDRHDNALQRAPDQHAQAGDHGPAELLGPDFTNRRKFKRLDKRHRVKITTAASVACGIKPISGASNSMVATAAAAVTSEAICDFPPTALTTAVCDVPPPAGMARKTHRPRSPNPLRPARGLPGWVDHPGTAKARPAAMVSV